MKALLRSAIVALLLFGAYAAFSMETTGPRAIPGGSPAPAPNSPSCPRPY